MVERVAVNHLMKVRFFLNPFTTWPGFFIGGVTANTQERIDTQGSVYADLSPLLGLLPAGSIPVR